MTDFLDADFEVIAARADSATRPGHLVWYFPNSERCRVASPSERRPGLSVMGLALDAAEPGETVRVTVRVADMERFRPKGPEGAA